MKKDGWMVSMECQKVQATEEEPGSAGLRQSPELLAFSLSSARFPFERFAPISPKMRSSL